MITLRSIDKCLLCDKPTYWCPYCKKPVQKEQDMTLKDSAEKMETESIGVDINLIRCADGITYTVGKGGIQSITRIEDRAFEVCYTSDKVTIVFDVIRVEGKVC